jgi:hypothetical protein
MNRRREVFKLVMILAMLSLLLTTASVSAATLAGSDPISLNQNPNLDVLADFQQAWNFSSNRVPSSSGYAADTSDFDGDGVHDHDELLFAQWYVPYLIFDEDESHDLIRTMLPLFQVTPYWKTGPNKNERYIYQIIVTYVFLYKSDKGLDIHGCAGTVSVLLDMLDLYRIFPSISKRDIEEIKGGHCGDSEMMRVILNYSLANKNWTAVSVEMKRHFDDPKTYSWSSLKVNTIAAGRNGCQAAFGNCYHPVIYVSQNKHAMYTALEGDNVGCETVGSKKIKKWGVTFCTISWEDCDSNDSSDKVIPSILDAQNAGEIGHFRYSQVSQTNVNNASQYSGEYIWNSSNPDFCGGQKSCSSCAGSLNGKWKVFNFSGFQGMINNRSVM